MVIEFTRISAPHGKRQDIGRALASLVGPIGVQPGCLTCRLSQQWQEQDVFEMEARWESEKDLVVHLQSDEYKKLLLLIELSATPPILEFFTVLQTRGLDLIAAARVRN